MTRHGLLLLISLLSQLVPLSQAAGAPGKTDLPGRLATKLSEGEVIREAWDEKHHPHFMKFLKSVDVAPRIVPTDPRNAHLIKTTHVFQPTVDLWSGFFKAAAQDRLTALKAFALLSREIKKKGIVVFGPGKDFEDGVTRNHVDLGLALPATRIGTAIWAPDPTHPDPEFLLHLKIFYTEPYTHQFPDNILDANLKIGFGPEETYWMDGKEYRQHTIDTDIFYGPKNGIGFRNIRGIGGQKKGFMGVVQSILFFLPDAVHAMTIDEKKNQLVSEALMEQRVSEFETNPLYSIKIVQ